ncbi:hypothetical protein ABPG75_000640 [Micractinium tetrahymenae]
MLRCAPPALALAPQPGDVLEATASLCRNHLPLLERLAARGAPYNAVLQEARTQLVLLLPALPDAAARLELPGDAAYSAHVWTQWLDDCSLILEHGDAVAAALMADSGSGRLGSHVVHRLLVLLSGLARVEAPGSAPAEAAGREAEVAVLRDRLAARAAAAAPTVSAAHAPAAPAAPAAADAPEGGPQGQAAEFLWAVRCWKEAVALLLHPELDLFTHFALSQDGTAVFLAGSMAAVLEQQQRRQQRQQRTMGELSADGLAARCHLAIAAAAGRLVARILQARGEAFDCLAPNAEALTRQRPQLGDVLPALRHTQSMNGARALWYALPSFASAAAMLSAAVAARTAEQLDRAHGLHALLHVSAMLAHRAGAILSRLQLPLPEAEISPLLHACEAALRCASRLQAARPAQGFMAEAVEECFPEASFFCFHSLAFCLRWAQASRSQLAAVPAESLLGSLATLAATICKCSVQLAVAAQAQGRQPAALPLQCTEQQLLDAAGWCEQVAQLAVAEAAGASELCQRSKQPGSAVLAAAPPHR